MDALLQATSVNAAVAPAETSAFNPEITNIAQSNARAIDLGHLRSLHRYAAATAEALAWGLSALYLVGAAALGVAILYYTFAR